MSFKITCTCGRQFGVKDKYAGKKGKCPHCGASLILQPDKDESSAPASAPDTSAGKKSSTGSSAKTPAADAPVAKKSSAAPSKAVGEVRHISMMSISDDGTDTTSQTAGIRHVIKRFCPACGTRYKEEDARCAFCNAPLSAAEIVADAAKKRPPILPWLPRPKLSTNALIGVIAGCVLLVGLVVYVCMRPALQRKANLRTELTLVEQSLTTGNLLMLKLEMPEYPWNRPASVKAIGKWERHVGPAAFIIFGTGSYDLDRRELQLTGEDNGKTLTYRAAPPPLLHVAATEERTTHLRQILNEPGCDVNQRDVHGATALHAAARADQADAIELLLDRGADPTIRDENGLTPLDYTRVPPAKTKADKVLRQATARALPGPAKSDSVSPK